MTRKRLLWPIATRVLCSGAATFLIQCASQPPKPVADCRSGCDDASAQELDAVDDSAAADDSVWTDHVDAFNAGEVNVYDAADAAPPPQMPANGAVALAKPHCPLKPLPPVGDYCKSPPRCFDAQFGKVGSVANAVLSRSGGYLVFGESGSKPHRASVTALDCRGTVLSTTTCPAALSRWSDAVTTANGVWTVGSRFGAAATTGLVVHASGMVMHVGYKKGTSWSHSVIPPTQPNQGVSFQAGATSASGLVACGWQGPVALPTWLEFGDKGMRDGLATGFTFGGGITWQSRHPVVDMYTAATAIGSGAYAVAGLDTNGSLRGCLVRIAANGKSTWHRCDSPPEIASGFVLSRYTSIQYDGARIIAGGSATPSVLAHRHRAFVAIYTVLPGTPEFAIPEGARPQKGADPAAFGTVLTSVLPAAHNRIVWAGVLFSQPPQQRNPPYPHNDASTVQVIDSKSQQVHGWFTGYGSSSLKDVERSAAGGYVAVGWRQLKDHKSRAWIVKLPHEVSPACEKH